MGHLALLSVIKNLHFRQSKMANHFCQTNYLNIYQTDLRQIFRLVEICR